MNDPSRIVIISFQEGKHVFLKRKAMLFISDITQNSYSECAKASVSRNPASLTYRPTFQDPRWHRPATLAVWTRSPPASPPDAHCRSRAAAASGARGAGDPAPRRGGPRLHPRRPAARCRRLHLPRPRSPLPPRRLRWRRWRQGRCSSHRRLRRRRGIVAAAAVGDDAREGVHSETLARRSVAAELPLVDAPFGAVMSAERFEAAVEFGRSADALTTRSKEQVEEQPEQISHNIINQLHTETFNPREKATPYFFLYNSSKKIDIRELTCGWDCCCCCWGGTIDAGCC